MMITPREKQCLEWISNGKTATETAIILGISRSTVVTHLENAKKKLGAATLPHAVRVAILNKAID